MAMGARAWASARVAYVVGSAVLIFIMGKYSTPSSMQTNIPISHLVPTLTPPSQPKRVIFWNDFLGRTPRSSTWYMDFPKGSLELPLTCPSGNKCILSMNRTDPLNADSLVFHAANSYTVPKKRSAHQVYMMWTIESPQWTKPGEYYYKTYKRGDKFYNWTLTYSRHSDVVMEHGMWHKHAQRDPDALKNLPQMKGKRVEGKAMILLVMSNCGAPSKRDKYLTELRKHLAVDVFGGCGKQCPQKSKSDHSNSVSCYAALAATGQYKFYVAFENSICEDYISLKTFRALNSSLVPIVMGGKSAKDYIAPVVNSKPVLQPHSYIDVRSYATPKHLAQYLKELDKNDKKYLAYLNWKTDYWVEVGGFYHMNWRCPMCDALHNPAKTKQHRNINWATFWNFAKSCDSNLVSRLLSNVSKTTE